MYFVIFSHARYVCYAPLSLVSDGQEHVCNGGGGVRSKRTCTYDGGGSDSCHFGAYVLIEKPQCNMQ